MPLSFNKEIQSSYCQNTLFSITGVSLEWVDEAGDTRYFGHWSDNSNQDAATTMQNMHCKLCNDGDAMQLVNGLALGDTVWKGTDGTTTSSHCGKSIYG
jgi:hypothetical protein